jgi:hypothetical protein
MKTTYRMITLLLVAACGGTVRSESSRSTLDTGPSTETPSSMPARPDPDPGTTPAEACGAYYDSFSRMMIRCGEGQAKELGEREAYVRACALSVAAPGISPRAAARLLACANGTDALPLCALDFGERVSDCQLIAGSLPLRAPCLSAAQCTSGRCSGGTSSGGATTCGVCTATSLLGGACDPAKGSWCGPGLECMDRKCGPKPGLASPGESCARFENGYLTQRHCVAGNFCGRAADGSYQCEPLPSLGQECTTFCSAPLACIDNSCVARSGEGASCRSPSSCLSGLYCDRDSGTCRSPLIVGRGADCSAVTSVCERGLLCLGVPDGPQTCVPLLALGAACGVGVTGVCEPNLGCFQGRCQIPNASACQ